MYSEIKEAIDGMGGAFTAFKKSHDKRVDELQDRVEQIEAKGSTFRIGSGNEAKSLGDLAAKSLHDELPSLEKHRTLRLELDAKAAGDPVTTASARSIVYDGMGAPQGRVQGIQFALPQRNVPGGTLVEYARYTGVAGAAAQQAAEGDAKAGVTPTFSVIQQATLQFAGWTKVSRQALQDQAEVRRVVDTVLLRSLNTAIDGGVVSGATGFSGLLTLATAATSLVYTNMADAISEGQSVMESAGFAPDLVALNPADWLALMVAVAAGSGEYLSGSYLGALPDSVRGLRVVKSASVTAGKALLIDTAHVELVTVGGVVVEVGYSGTDFTSNLATVLVEQRLAPVFRTTGAARLITPKA